MTNSYSAPRDIKISQETIANDILAKYNAQREFHDCGNTKSYEFRLKHLVALKRVLLEHEKDVIDALQKDFRKPELETFLSDFGIITDELNHTIRSLKSWMKPKRVPTPLAIFPAYSSRIYPESKGVVLIIAPWNYPVNLTLIPLIGAVAAGNTVMVKPAHETSHSASVIDKIIKKVFQPEHVVTFLGEGAVLGPLFLETCRFDHIFFTGSVKVGKFIMQKAAEKLTPVTLELGGKNPAILDKTCHLSHSVNRLVWGKFLNAGQTCIAPDYLIIHEVIFDETIQLIKDRIIKNYGQDPFLSPHFARIINQEKCKKVAGYLTQGKILHGGRYNLEESYIEPTVIHVQNLDQPIMNEEVFGPIWPVITWKSMDELIPLIRKNRYPLSCYIYSRDNKLIQHVIDNAEFGNGGVNDNIVQFANKYMPFGGVQYSGHGRYHGKTSFETFSNMKGIVYSWTWLDHGLKYPPYKKWQKIIARWFLQ